jgi:hypothetical protein
MVSKYPHTATISWLSAGTTNTYGVWTPGTLNTLHITCDIQPTNGHIVAGAGGAILNYNWDIFAKRFTGDTTVPSKANLTFFSADHILVQIFNYQKHVEIKCQG